MSIDDIALELSGKMKIRQLQDKLSVALKPFMTNIDTMRTDTTYNKSDIQVKQPAPTIEDVLNYEEELLSTTEKQSSIEHNPRAKELLLKLQVLLKSRVVRSFVDLLAARKFSLSSLQKIQEIDDALDELRVMNLDLLYPEKCFLLEQGKTERAKRNMMMTLLFGLIGFEWVK